MRLRGFAFAATALSLFLALCGLALATSVYPDRAGDVPRGTGPDITSIRISNTATTIVFRIRFANTPPLRVSEREKFVDMLLIGIDVPPLGPPPAVPGGEWRGADFALGAHGPATAGKLVKLSGKASGSSRLVTTFPIKREPRALTFSIARRALGNPSWFAFSVAAARESERENGVADFAPARGTLRYVLDR